MLGGSFPRVELDGIGRGMLHLGALSGEAAERQQNKPEQGCYF